MNTCFESLENRELFSAPTVTDFHADAPVAAISVPLTLTTTAIAQAGVRAATFWLDIDANGQWSPGIDITLGDAWSGAANQQVTLSRTTVPSGSWPQHVRLLTNIVDAQGHWGTTPRLLQLERTTRPLASVVNISAPVVTPDELVTLTVTGVGSAQLRAASFFVDMNDNRIWEPGIDQPLGDTWTRVPGANAFRLTLSLGWAIGIGFESPNALGVQSRNIGANVQDVNGIWSSIAATQSVVIAPRANVLSFSVTGSATSVQLTAVVQQWSAGGWAVVLPGAPNAVTSAAFFYDANRNGRFDGGDTSLGTVAASPNMGSLGGTFTLNTSAASTWPWPRQFGAYATDARISGDPRSPVRIFKQLGDSVNPVNVTPWVTQVRQAPAGVPRNDPWVVAGDPFLIQSTVNGALGSSIGLASAIAFYDNDRDGQFNANTDQLIATQPLSGGGTQFPVFSFAIAGNGQRHIAVAGIDTGGRIGPARSTVVLITSRPTATLISVNMVTDNGARFLEVVVSAAAPAGIRSITGVLLSHDDIQFAPSSGTLQNGRWTLRIATSGLPSGTVPLTLRIANFYNVERVLDVSAQIT